MNLVKNDLNFRLNETLKMLKNEEKENFVEIWKSCRKIESLGQLSRYFLHLKKPKNFNTSLKSQKFLKSTNSSFPHHIIDMQVELQSRQLFHSCTGTLNSLTKQ